MVQAFLIVFLSVCLLESLRCHKDSISKASRYLAQLDLVTLGFSGLMITAKTIGRGRPYF